MSINGMPLMHFWAIWLFAFSKAHAWFGLAQMCQYVPSFVSVCHVFNIAKGL